MEEEKRATEESESKEDVFHPDPYPIEIGGESFAILPLPYGRDIKLAALAMGLTSNYFRGMAFSELDNAESAEIYLTRAISGCKQVLAKIINQSPEWIEKNLSDEMALEIIPVLIEQNRWERFFRNFQRAARAMNRIS